MTTKNTMLIVGTFVYNSIVVVATAVSVYYISGWMFFLLLALANVKTSTRDEE